MVNAFDIDGWTTEDLVFQWRKGDPVQVAKNMHLPRFTLESYEADLCNSVTNTGNKIKLNAFPEEQMMADTD